MKTTLLATLAIVAAGFTSTAQVNLQDELSLSRPHSEEYEYQTGAKGTATGSRLIAESYSRYSTPVSAFQFADSSNYTYSNGRGGEPSAALMYDESTYLIARPTGIRNNKKYLKTYNAGNLLTTYVAQLWDTAHVSWVNSSRNRYFYDANNRTATDTLDAWNAAGANWITPRGTIYFRNSAGKITTTYTVAWNTTTSRWDTTSQNIYTYDAANNVIDFISRNSSSGTMKNYSHEMYTYDAANIVTTIAYQSWNTTTNSWQNTYKYTFEINVHGDRNKQISQSWNSTGVKWDTSSQYIYNYDAAYNQVAYTYQTYNTGNWKNVDLYNRTFNSMNQMTSLITKTWNAGGFWESTNSDFKRLYYYENYTTGIRSQAVSGGMLSLWPVPASQVLNMKITWDNAQAYTTRVIDMQGRVCMEWASSSQKTGLENINTASLPAGTYVIILTGSNGGAQRSLFTVAK